VRRERVLLLLALGTIIIAFLACGKKGPPLLPESDGLLKVKNLTAEWGNGSVILRGQVLASLKNEKDIPEIMGCRVYYAWYASENPPCEGCPIQYKVFREIKAKVHSKGGFYCEVEGVKGKGIHFFKVSMVDANGRVGLPSQGAKLVLD